MKVLIVDDDYMICQCLSQRINWEKIGCEELLIAGNGREAMQIVHNKRPNVVVTDIKMPFMDGKELCKVIHEKYPEIAVLFLSAYEDFATAQMALDYEVKGFILKPLSSERLLELENMIQKVIFAQEKFDFITRLMGDEYREYHETIIEENNVQALESFMNRVKAQSNSSMLWNINVCKCLIKPLITYGSYKVKRQINSIYEEEKRILDEMCTLNQAEWLSFIYQKYLDEMSRHSNRMDDPLIAEIKQKIEADFQSPELDVNALAGIAGVSAAYIGQLFLHKTGVKINDYILEMRMQYAIDQVVNTRKTIKTIAFESGYTDANYFIKVFRNKTSLTPNAYRKKYG